METIIEIPALIKVLQLFALTTYFAGTLHVVRLFVAHRQAMAKWEPDRTILVTQFAAMEKRTLYFLNWPMLILFAAIGFYTLWLRPDLVQRAFMQVLFGYFALLMLYQVMVQRIHIRLKRGEEKWSVIQLRAWTSVATLFLLSLVVLLILRERASWVWGSIGLLIVGGVVILVLSAMRKNNEPTPDA
ncbi:MAG TPA: CopD family protein [Flavobacteriales bacterium]|jgi:uncharacterized membrane protein|nr:CopD family protein [Flavobacteriales bacterium]MBK8530677.1 CopD family protein [Flavobacteriales bacterium]MCC6910722.1 CopD family protein [Flavobacteriales bacterium]HQW06549.1 CopD family protein [Flavobacteriales bacterium]HQW99530.1 CopD family protein [Flavobacteriales bacterium]